MLPDAVIWKLAVPWEDHKEMIGGKYRARRIKEAVQLSPAGQTNIPFN